MSTGKGMGTGGGGCESGWRGEKGEEGVCGYLLCSESGSCGGVKGEGGMMGGSLVGVSGLAVGLPVIYLIGLMQFFFSTGHFARVCCSRRGCWAGLALTKRGEGRGGEGGDGDG